MEHELILERVQDSELILLRFSGVIAEDGVKDSDGNFVPAKALDAAVKSGDLYPVHAYPENPASSHDPLRAPVIGMGGLEYSSDLTKIIHRGVLFNMPRVEQIITRMDQDEKQGLGQLSGAFGYLDSNVVRRQDGNHINPVRMIHSAYVPQSKLPTSVFTLTRYKDADADTKSTAEQELEQLRSRLSKINPWEGSN